METKADANTDAINLNFVFNNLYALIFIRLFNKVVHGLLVRKIFSHDTSGDVLNLIKNGNGAGNRGLN